MLVRPGLPRPSRGEAVAAAFYAAAVAAMWPSPLLGLLHAESSAVAAGCAFAASGLVATGAFRRGRPPGSVLGRTLGLAAIPWALLTLSLLWRANCGYLQGLALYLLFVPPSVILAVALAWALTGTGARRPAVAFVGVGLVLATVPVVLGPGLHPQLYSYNPIWGGVLGPIYDQELAVRPGLLAHRAIILLWAAWLLAAGTWLRTRRLAGVGSVLSVCIGVAYLLAADLGVVTTAGVIERRLAGSMRLGPFVFHYDPGALPGHELRAIGETLLYRHARYAGVLGVAPAGAIHVYLFPDEDVRAALTGARTTSVTPVWLRRPQMHLLQRQATPENVAHELAHVFAREFGGPVFRASPALGLVEGLAVALEPPHGLPTPAEQVAAARALAPDAAGRLARGPAEAVAASMGPIGFWSGRGAVSYLTSGAFVGWLLERHGAERLRRAYRTGDFAAAYGRSVDSLAREWAAHVSATPVTPEALALAEWRFSQPSLLEMRCPHHVPRERRLTRRADELMTAGDVRGAAALYREALGLEPRYAPALVGWASASIAAGAPPEAVAARVADHDTLEASVLAVQGDALRLAGRHGRAERAYAAAAAVLPPYARRQRESLVFRRTLPASAIPWLHRPAARRAAGALDSLSADHAAARWFAAARWLDAGEPARALAALSGMPAQPRPAADAARLGALGDLARYAGRPRDAARYATAAAAAWRAAGSSALARREMDRADEARWVALLWRRPRQGWPVAAAPPPVPAPTQ